MNLVEIDYMVRMIALKHQIFYRIEVGKPFAVGGQEETFRHLYLDGFVSQEDKQSFDSDVGWGSPDFMIGERTKGYRLWKNMDVQREMKNFKRKNYNNKN